MSLIKTVIAGSGNPHIPGYLRGRGQGMFEFVAVSDEDPGRLENDRRILSGLPVDYYRDHVKMFDAHPEAEAVIIGSDNRDHFGIFAEAVRRKLHIYMMKVISMDEGECRRMLEMERSYSKVIQVEYELHFRPQFQYARKLLQSGKLGSLKSIYLSNVSQSPCNYFPNWGDPVLSYGRFASLKPGSAVGRGGALTDHPHPFDMIRFLTGREFKNVYAVAARNQRSKLRVEDNIVLTGRLDDGTAYQINPSYSHLEEEAAERRLIWPKSLECNLKLTGEKGCYCCDYFDRPLYICGRELASPDRLIVEMQPTTEVLQNNNMLGCFHDCIRGLRSRPESVLNDSYQAVRVMNAAYESVYSGKVVEL